MFQDITRKAAQLLRGIYRFLCVFLTNALVSPPRKKNGRVRVIRLGQVKHLFLFAVVLIYSELVLRLLNGTGLLGHVFLRLLFLLSFSCFLNVFTTLFRPRINRRITMGLLAVIAVVYITECLIRSSFQIYMTPAAVLRGAGDVVEGYGGQLVSAIVGGILPMALFFLPLILYALTGRRFIKARRYRLSFGALQLGLGVVFLLLSSFLASRGSTALLYTGQFDFDTAAITFGLPTALRLSFTHGEITEEGFAPREDGEMVLPAEEEAPGEIPAEGDPQTAGTETGTEASASAVTRVPGYNILNIDFDAFRSDDNETLNSVLDYVESQTPSPVNEYTGIFAGKNLILITAEALSDQAISKSLTPTLYRMVHNGFYFSDYYQPTWGGSTITGELSFLTGLIPSADINVIYKTIGENQYFTMGNQLQRQGYFNAAFHNGKYDYYKRNTTHENFGYGIWAGSRGLLDEICGKAYPTDSEMITATLDYYKDHAPFSLYYMTVSGHAEYTKNSKYVEENLETVKAKAYREYKDTTLYYLCYQYELEKAMTALIEKLEEMGIADDTVICMTADHYPYGLRKSSAWHNKEDYVEDLYGGKADNIWDHDHNCWILWSGCLENELSGMVKEISAPTSSMDILPTLSNLFGLEYDSRLLVGRDVFSDAEPIVMWNNGSWITEKGRRDVKSNVTESLGDTEMDEDYITRITNIAKNKYEFSRQVRSLDLYGILFGPDTDTSSNLETTLKSGQAGGETGGAGTEGADSGDSGAEGTDRGAIETGEADPGGSAGGELEEVPETPAA